MIINEDILRRDTIQLLKQIDMQIAEVERTAKRKGVQSYQLQDDNGNWPLIPLLLAKSQSYATLVAVTINKN